MSDGLGRCRSCGAPVRWAVVRKTNRMIPLDVEPPAAGAKPNVSFTGEANAQGSPFVEIVTPGTGTTMTHFATCPNAAAHRTKKPAAAKAPARAKAPAALRVLCSTIGCDVVIGADGKGAKLPRPCQRCAREIERALNNNAAARRRRIRASRR